jgi:hypothetical protein
VAAFNKIQQFAYDLSKKVHNLNADGISIVLSNTAPNASTNQVLADITQIANSNGYTTNGQSVTPVGSSATGTFTLSGTAVVWTSVTGNMGPFQYVVLYNTTSTTPLKPLIGWWDYGSALTLNGANGDTFTVQFNGSATTGTILTVA